MLSYRRVYASAVDHKWPHTSDGQTHRPAHKQHVQADTEKPHRLDCWLGWRGIRDTRLGGRIFSGTQHQRHKARGKDFSGTQLGVLLYCEKASQLTWVAVLWLNTRVCVCVYVCVCIVWHLASYTAPKVTPAWESNRVPAETWLTLTLRGIFKVQRSPANNLIMRLSPPRGNGQDQLAQDTKPCSPEATPLLPMSPSHSL